MIGYIADDGSPPLLNTFLVLLSIIWYQFHGKWYNFGCRKFGCRILL